MKRLYPLFALAALTVAAGCSDDTKDDTGEPTTDEGNTDDGAGDDGNGDDGNGDDGNGDDGNGDDGGGDDTGTAPDPDDLLDLSGSWSGDCEIADALFGDSTQINMTLTSTDQLGYYDNVQGRVLTGTGSVTVFYGGTDASWSTEIEGISTDNAVLLVAHEPAGNWLLEVDAGATTDTITGACGVAAWSLDLLEFVYFWGDLSMTRD